jgi:ribonuclease P protein subunit POP4
MQMNKIIASEFIGCQTEVVDSTNPLTKGVKGKIIDETKNLLVIRTSKDEIKKLTKNENTFLIKGVEIKGQDIIKKPEERIKLLRKNK